MLAVRVFRVHDNCIVLRKWLILAGIEVRYSCQKWLIY